LIRHQFRAAGGVVGSIRQPGTKFDHRELQTSPVKTNVHLMFKEIYAQNQDSMGAVEYSIDGGFHPGCRPLVFC